MSEVEKPTTAFILSLIAGIFILLGGGAMTMFGSWRGNYGYGMMGGYGGYGGYGGWGGMMGPGFGMMGGLGYGFGFLGVAGLIFGLIVIISALMLNNKPEQHSTWGILIIVFSVLSIFGSAMGGFGIGLILGVIGGILAVTWKTPTSGQK
ncbi:MAG: DUF6114 domain-containing protein [Candidatus Bathyarchaeia archaeon]|jgi:hypothetical protein